MPQVNIPVASDWLVAGAARAQSGRRSRRHCCLPQLSVLSFHVCCSCWRRWKALWVMLRAGWTFLRLGSPIRDRPHSPKYACRGSGGQEAETTGGGGVGGNRYGVKKRRRGGGEEKELVWELVGRVREAAFKSDGSVDVTKKSVLSASPVVCR